jgi:hypothetical protein
MQTALLAINHSTLGWLQYANYPDAMRMFNLDALKKNQSVLNEIVEACILHAIEAAEKDIQKGLGLLKLDEELQPCYV